MGSYPEKGVFILKRYPNGISCGISQSILVILIYPIFALYIL